MELRQIRYFIAVCETLNFTRAAERCHVTQPALTRAIQRLERELNGALLRRGRHRTQLTELGLELRPFLEQILVAADAARDFTKRIKTNGLERLRLGLPPMISARLVASSLAELTRRNPLVEIELRSIDLAMAARELGDDRLDAALLVEAENSAKTIKRWPLFTENTCLAFSAGHRLAGIDKITPSALRGEILLQRADCPVAALLHRYCREAGVTLQRRHVIDGEDHIQNLVAAGIGLAVLPEHFPRLSSLGTRPLPRADFERRIALATASGRRHSAALDAFIKSMRARDFRQELAAEKLR